MPDTSPTPYRPNGKGNGHAHSLRAENFTQTCSEFLEHFIKPDYVVDDLFLRGYLYSLTAKTGSGKTAVALYIACCIAMGYPIGDREVSQGRVLYLAGENPMDVQWRLMAMAQHMGFDPADIPLDIISGTKFSLSRDFNQLVAETHELGDLMGVVVDTTAAYFEGSEFNSNSEAQDHAESLRKLTELPGNPCALALSHPTKNAAPDNLLPYGGGAFLNSIDGNATAHISWPIVKVHWQGKWRGPEFDPIHFVLEGVTHERLVTSKGKHMPTVIAKFLAPEALDAIETKNAKEVQRLIDAIAADGGCSLMEYAIRAQILDKDGKPRKGWVDRTIRTLIEDKIIIGQPKRYRLKDRSLATPINRGADDDDGSD
jgi:hypothetical protein